MPHPLAPNGALLLALDTCGATGSVALGRVSNGVVQTLAETALEGRSYSATLLAAIRDLLAGAQVELCQLAAIVVLHGPGSFTGVRVGLSAAKGLAEAAALPLIALSRLQVLAAKARAAAAALDAHRHEVFLLVPEAEAGRELLAGADELKALAAPSSIALCDEAAAALLASAWPSTELLRADAPTAADALPLALARLSLGRFDDVALIDGHYLRRSDAEIFGDKAAGA